MRKWVKWIGVMIIGKHRGIVKSMIKVWKPILCYVKITDSLLM